MFYARSAEKCIYPVPLTAAIKCFIVSIHTCLVSFLQTGRGRRGKWRDWATCQRKRKAESETEFIWSVLTCLLKFDWFLQSRPVDPEFNLVWGFSFGDIQVLDIHTSTNTECTCVLMRSHTALGWCQENYIRTISKVKN